MDLHQTLECYQNRIQNKLTQLFNAKQGLSDSLNKAMRYACISEGKTLRPALVYATAESLSAPLEPCDAAAMAVELIHSYSLIHDDLPAMDNADLRRGKPSCHKAFDEGIAILAGDTLQALAFQVLSEDTHHSFEQRILLLQTLAHASGPQGMADGQALDITFTQPTLDELKEMYNRKTGALIEASIEMGAIAAGLIKKEQREPFIQFGKALGLAYQIHDDILDIEADTETLGKPAGIDATNEKHTIANAMGLANAKQAVNDLYQQALNALKTKSESTLSELAFYLTHRNH